MKINVSYTFNHKISYIHLNKLHMHSKLENNRSAITDIFGSLLHI